jgi:hypothetical protein
MDVALMLVATCFVLSALSIALSPLARLRVMPQPARA